MCIRDSPQPNQARSGDMVSVSPTSSRSVPRNIHPAGRVVLPRQTRICCSQLRPGLPLTGLPGHPLFWGTRVASQRVGVYIDYSNVYSGARDAFALTSEQGYRGNVNPDYLAKRVALQ